MNNYEVLRVDYNTAARIPDFHTWDLDDRWRVLRQTIGSETSPASEAKLAVLDSIPVEKRAMAIDSLEIARKRDKPSN